MCLCVSGAKRQIEGEPVANMATFSNLGVCLWLHPHWSEVGSVLYSYVCVNYVGFVCNDLLLKNVN